MKPYTRPQQKMSQERNPGGVRAKGKGIPGRRWRLPVVWIDPVEMPVLAIAINRI